MQQVFVCIKSSSCWKSARQILKNWNWYKTKHQFMYRRITYFRSFAISGACSVKRFTTTVVGDVKLIVKQQLFNFLLAELWNHRFVRKNDQKWVSKREPMNTEKIFADEIRLEKTKNREWLFSWSCPLLMKLGYTKCLIRKGQLWKPNLDQYMCTPNKPKEFGKVQFYL